MPQSKDWDTCMYEKFGNYSPLHSVDGEIARKEITILGREIKIVKEGDNALIKYDKDICTALDFMFVVSSNSMLSLKTLEVDGVVLVNDIIYTPEDIIFEKLYTYLKSRNEVSMFVEDGEYVFSCVYYIVEKDKSDLHYLVKTQELLLKKESRNSIEKKKKGIFELIFLYVKYWIGKK